MRGAGVVSVAANFLPELVAVVYELSRHGSHHKAQAIISRMQMFTQALSELPNPSAIKWAMSHRGKISPFTRLPLSPLTHLQEVYLQDALIDLTPLLNFNPDFV